MEVERLHIEYQLVGCIDLYRESFVVTARIGYNDMGWTVMEALNKYFTVFNGGFRYVFVQRKRVILTFTRCNRNQGFVFFTDFHT